MIRALEALARKAHGVDNRHPQMATMKIFGTKGRGF